MVNLLDLYPLCFDEFLEAIDPKSLSTIGAFAKIRQSRNFFTDAFWKHSTII